MQRRQDARQRGHGVGRIQADRSGAIAVASVDPDRHVTGFAVVQDRVQVGEGHRRRGRADVVDRQGGTQLAQRCAGGQVGHAVGQGVEAVVPAVEHRQQRRLDVRFQVERIARRVRDQVHARQRAVGHQGLRTHFERARAFLERVRQRGRHAGAVAFARQVHQHIEVARVHVAPREHLGARLLVQRDDRAAHLRQPFRIGFQRLGARQRFQDLQELLGAEALLAHSGQAQDPCHAPARERQARQRCGGGGAREQADEAVLAEDGAMGVGIAHADEVERLVAVQGAGHVGLDDRQRVRTVRQGFEVARDVRQAGAVHRMRSILQHADAAGDVAFELAHARLDHVIGVAERLEAFVLGPVEEGRHFGAFGAVAGRGGGHAGHAVGHGDGVAPHHGGVARDHPQLADQRVELLGREVFRQQAQDHGFQRHAGFAHRERVAGAVAAHGQHRVHDAAHGRALAAQRHDDGIDQVGHVVVQDQQGAGDAAAPVGIAQAGNLAAVAGAPSGLREALAQQRRQAVGRGAGQVFVVERGQPGADQGLGLACSPCRRCCPDQIEGLLAQFLWHLFHLASPMLLV